jgi:RNA polymerase sigma factor (sigma-70 family)
MPSTAKPWGKLFRMDEAAARNRDREAQWRAWMIAAQQGNAGCYEELLQSLLSPLRSYFRRRGVDGETAEDLVQTVLLSIHRARHTYRAERPFAPWLWSIARNALVDVYRVKAVRNERESSLPMGVEAAELVVLGPESVDGAVLRRDLDRALMKLPDRQREAVHLLHVEGLSVKEAAARVGTTVGALKVRAHRGYRALRKLLGGPTDDD